MQGSSRWKTTHTHRSSLSFLVFSEVTNCSEHAQLHDSVFDVNAPIIRMVCTVMYFYIITYLFEICKMRILVIDITFLLPLQLPHVSMNQRTVQLGQRVVFAEQGVMSNTWFVFAPKAVTAATVRLRIPCKQISPYDLKLRCCACVPVDPLWTTSTFIFVTKIKE